MGRVTASPRKRITGSMKRLRKRYRATFKDTAFQWAFDELWKAWAGEMAAMIYWSHHSVLDMLILTGAVDNRRVLVELRRELETLNRRVKQAIST